MLDFTNKMLESHSSLLFRRLFTAPHENRESFDGFLLQIGAQIPINFDKNLDNIQYKLTLNKTNYYKVFSHRVSDLQLSKLINTIKIETEKIWKKKNTIFSSLVTSLEFTTNIQNIRQLNIIRSKLQKLNNIKQIKDIEVSSKAYRGKIYYSGTINDLNKNLEEINFILKENFNSWRLLTNE